MYVAVCYDGGVAWWRGGVVVLRYVSGHGLGTCGRCAKCACVNYV